MFWTKNKKTDKRKKSKKGLQAGRTGQKNNSGQELSVGTKTDSQRLREEALANVRAARENLGEDTIQRIAAAMTAKQNSAIEKAKAQIQNADSDRVLDEIMYMMEDRD